MKVFHQSIEVRRHTHTTLTPPVPPSVFCWAQTRLALIQSHLNDVKALVKLKNPSLFLQLERQAGGGGGGGGGR